MSMTKPVTAVATLLLQVESANPLYTQVGEDFFTMTYQAITD